MGKRNEPFVSVRHCDIDTAVFVKISRDNNNIHIVLHTRWDFNIKTSVRHVIWHFGQSQALRSGRQASITYILYILVYRLYRYEWFPRINKHGDIYIREYDRGRWKITVFVIFRWWVKASELKSYQKKRRRSRVKKRRRCHYT